MRIKLGWTGEFSGQWFKADVEVDEGDLTRLLIEGGVPSEVTDRLSTKIAFRLLKNEAELLLLTKLQEHGYPEDKASARSSQLAGQNEAVLAVLSQKYAAVG